MTNPDNIVRVRARNGGRASVYEANGWAQAFSAGLVEGNGVIQNTSPDMNVLVGGSTTKPDVILATNPAGYKIALDIVGQQAVAITAPATNSRISSIVAYTDDLALATTEDTVTGSPASCGLIVVNGTTSGSPTAPDDGTIRSAITADGATGSQAAYCIIANITVSSATTAITNSLISMNSALTDKVSVNTAQIEDDAVTNDKVDWSSISKVLYNDPTGTTGEVLLSETSANFEYIEIFYRTNDQDYGFTKVYQPNGKKVSLSTAVHAIGTGELVYKVSIKEFDGVNLVKVTDGACDEYGEASSASTNISHQNNVYITRVVGYYPQ